jgi:hypothetical protein
MSRVAVPVPIILAPLIARELGACPIDTDDIRIKYVATNGVINVFIIVFFVSMISWSLL